MQHIYKFSEMILCNEITLGPNYYIHTKKDGTQEAMSMYQILDCWYSGYTNKGCLFWVPDQQRWTLLADFLGEEVGPRTKMPKEIPPPPPQLAKPKLPDRPPFLTEIDEILSEITALPQSDRESEYRYQRTRLRELDSKLKAKVIYHYYFEFNQNLVGPITLIEINALRQFEYVTDNTPFWDYYSGTWRPLLEINSRSKALFKNLAANPIEVPQRYDETDIRLLTNLGISINENL